jgi:starch synthase (maltosyl-transferring)
LRSDRKATQYWSGDYERADSAVANSSSSEAINRLSIDASNSGLRLILDITLDRVAATGEIARARPDLFIRRSHADIIDPRQDQLGPDALPARYDHPERARELVAWFAEHLIRFLHAGAAGFRLLGLAHVPPEYLSVLTRAVRGEGEGVDCDFYGWTPGLSWSLLPTIEEAGLDAVFASTPWWNGRDSWCVDEYNALRGAAPRVIGMPEAPYEERAAARTRADNARQISVRALRIAAASGTGGILVPMGFEFGARPRMPCAGASPDHFARIKDVVPFNLTNEIRAANALMARLAARGTGGEMRSLSGPAAPVTALLQSDSVDIRYAQRVIVSLINTSDAMQPPRRQVRCRPAPERLSQTRS